MSKRTSSSKGLTLRKTGFSASKTALALSIPGLLAAQPVLAADAPIRLDTLQIEERSADTNPYAEKGAPYKAKRSADQRHVKDIAETPQTITVLTQTMVQESGKMDLREILAAQPGITLGTGENGNAFGDRYVIRGQEARSDVFVDGLRDPGMTIRESFAVEQIEITKGPSSTFAGRGSTGGAVNGITKQASTEYDFNKVMARLGTDSYQRYTLDSNQSITDDIAVRANLLFADQDVPDRDPASRERKGAALAGLWEASDELQLRADYYYLDATDKPDLGSYIVSGGKPNDDMPVYVQDQDFMQSDVEVFTFRADYEFSDTLRLSNATRVGSTDNGYVVTGARGNTRAATDPVAPGAFTITGSTHQSWQEVDHVVNQTNLYLDTNLGGMEHQFVFGGEYSMHEVLNGVYNVTNGAQNCLVGNNASASYCFVDGNGAPLPNINNVFGRQISKGRWDIDWSVDTLSLYAMDTIDLSDKWTLFLGIRLDDFDYKLTTQNNSLALTDYAYDDRLWNGHLGLTYNITENGNVYASWSSSSEINGGESDVGTSCGYGGVCVPGGTSAAVGASEPEQAENLEVGTKWNLMDGKLLATAALFRITKDDVMEAASGDSYVNLGTLNTGKNRVEGVEVSLVGNITSTISTQFGATWMESEILEANIPASIGAPLSNFADDSYYLQLRWQALPKFSFGGTATYSSAMYAGQPDTAAGTNIKVPSYTVFDVFATYEFNEQFNVRLNVGNITDEDYYLAAYRSGAFAYIGDARNAQLAVNYEF